MNRDALCCTSKLTSESGARSVERTTWRMHDVSHVAKAVPLIKDVCGGVEGPDVQYHSLNSLLFGYLTEGRDETPTNALALPCLGHN